MKNSQLVSRRRFLTSTVALATIAELQRAAWALGFSPGVDVCKLAREQEQGPYYIEDEMLRSNVVEDRVGLPLALRIGLLDARNCKPLNNVAVDIWSCDALGLYSGFTKQNPMGPGGPGAPGQGFGPGGPPPGFDPEHPGNRPGPPEGFGPRENLPTDKLTFLRGIQITDSDGVVNFQTIVPGFYMGRTNHIHFRVRTGIGPDARSLPAGHVSHTGQIFFPEEIATELMKHPPYSTHNIHRTTQQEDMVFTRQHGDLFVASFKPVNRKDGKQAYRAELIAAVDPATTPNPVGGPGGPPPR
jgi:protocatechuate 3,4-dioxygenase beta subunit